MLEWKEFEEMFGAKEGVVLKDSGKQAEKKPDLISVVDPKKAYNCCETLLSPPRSLQLII